MTGAQPGTAIDKIQIQYTNCSCICCCTILCQVVEDRESLGNIQIYRLDNMVYFQTTVTMSGEVNSVIE